MKYRYATHTKYGRWKGQAKGSGRVVDPTAWCTGPDPVRHDKYYGWLKHRSQAQYRGEPHEITWEEWEHLWTDEAWFARGRSVDSLCLSQIDYTQGWCINNVELITRAQHLAKPKRRKKDVQ